jgi:hypothetical protein
MVAKDGNAKIHYTGVIQTESCPFNLESLVKVIFKFESKIKYTLKLQLNYHILAGLNHESVKSRSVPELSSQEKEIKDIRDCSLQKAQHARFSFKEYHEECFKVL